MQAALAAALPAGSRAALLLPARMLQHLPALLQPLSGPPLQPELQQHRCLKTSAKGSSMGPKEEQARASMLDAEDVQAMSWKYGRPRRGWQVGVHHALHARQRSHAATPCTQVRAC